MQKFFLMSGSLLACLAVGLGAFGAHALKESLVASGRLSTYETAVQYHFYHALGILLVYIFMFHNQHNYLTYAGILMVAGVVIFSGSLYTLSITGITWLGAITPIGGLCFIIAWILVFLTAFKAS
ncbi:MAG: DUF423 domain-containing protein [Bacteroidota bacterium]